MRSFGRHMNMRNCLIGSKVVGRKYTTPHNLISYKEIFHVMSALPQHLGDMRNKLSEIKQMKYIIFPCHGRVTVNGDHGIAS
jgi:hypothetical protein